MNNVNKVGASRGLDQRSTAIVKLFAQSLIESVATAPNIVAGVLGNVFNYSFGQARSGFASMLVPALLMGAMSSDAVGHQASGINRGGTMLEQYQNLENQQASLAQQAQDLSEYSGKSGKRKAPAAISLNKGMSADDIKANRQSLKAGKKAIKQHEKQAQKAADQVKDLAKVSKAAKAKVKHLKHDLTMAQVKYDANPSAVNETALHDAQRRFTISKKIIAKNKNMGKEELQAMDQDLQSILDAERAAASYRKQAQARWFSRTANADRNQAEAQDQRVATVLSKYSINQMEV
ncbi:MAG: hypothetical protein OXU45_07395 [Candidatus Melainabacteria bacterium]|nr:hypothetical protein [Candidatus Melainabacteria bacterium]